MALVILLCVVLGAEVEKTENSFHDIRVKEGVFEADVKDVPESSISDLKIVASKNGKKYYFEHCSGVKRIKEANKIWFSSEFEAKKAGLTLASNCY